MIISSNESASESPSEPVPRIFLAAPFAVDGDFPGSKLFWRLAAHCGLQRSDFDLSGRIDTSPACTVICLGSDIFYQLTGLRVSIDHARGYLFKRSDCVPIDLKVWEEVGVYKATSKKGWKKGDPKFGWVRRTVTTRIPEHVQWIIPILPPETVQFQGFKSIPALKADLLRAVRASRFPFVLGNEPFHFLTYPVGSDRPPVVCIDIETIGFSNAIERLGVCANGTVWTAPWNSNTERVFLGTLTHKPIIVGHNLAFDVPRLEAATGHHLGNRFFDTMLAAHLLQPDLYKGLEKVASLYLDVRPWKHLSESDPERYNAMDVHITHALCAKQLDALADTGQRDLFVGTLMPALRVLIDMSKRGIRIDREHLKGWQDGLIVQQRAALAHWNELAPAINPLSPSQVAHYLYDVLGLPTQRSKTGGTTTDAGAIQHLIRHPHSPSETLKALLEIKRVSKLISTYAKVEVGDDDCVHPSYVPSGKDTDNGAAATGRMAASNPNPQNQPPEAKRMFIPHMEGMALAEFDFSQIELRIAAALSGDVQLQSALKGDVHARTMDLLGIDRTRAKNLLYGTLYGAGPRKLARVLEAKGFSTTEAQCRTLQDSLSRAYPDLFSWRRSVVAEGTARRFLTNSFGRRRYFYGGETSAPAMMDFLPQSNAADILWSQLVDLDRIATQWGGALLTAVHDSVLFELPTSSTAMIKEVQICMEQPYDRIAPSFNVPVQIKVGSNWGEMRAFTHDTDLLRCLQKPESSSTSDPPCPAPDPLPTTNDGESSLSNGFTEE